MMILMELEMFAFETLMVTVLLMNLILAPKMQKLTKKISVPSKIVYFNLYSCIYCHSDFVVTFYD